jgi:hypothetical protein
MIQELIKKIQRYKEEYNSIPKHLGKIVEHTVLKNVEEYLFSLNDVSPEEEIRMTDRRNKQSERSENKKFNDRLNTFKNINQQVKQDTGEELVDQDTVQNPLKAALIDDSILQLYKMSNEISLIIKSGKIDGPSLKAIIEQAVDNSTKKATLSEVKGMMKELVQQVQKKFQQLTDAELEASVKKVVNQQIGSILK